MCMPYININEYDNTIAGVVNTNNNNIVAIPINAVDGPSDKWLTIYSYNDFIQTFGNNPNSTSNMGNSWEYAANLLLRGMPVCVRRITHTLDEYGRNLELLPGASTAEGYVQLQSVENLSATNIITNYTQLYVNSNESNNEYVKFDLTNPDYRTLPMANNEFYSVPRYINDNTNNALNSYTINLISDKNKNKISIKSNKLNEDITTIPDETSIQSDVDKQKYYKIIETEDIFETLSDSNYNTFINSGKIIITNTSNDKIKIKSFVFTDLDDNYKYDSKIETIKATNKSLTKSEYIIFTDANNEETSYPRSIYDTSNITSYFELKPGHSILINKIIKNASINIKLYNVSDNKTVNVIPFSIEAFSGNAGSYKMEYNTYKNINNIDYDGIFELVTFIPSTKNDDDKEKALIDESNNIINLFKAEYKAVGSNGNFINVAIKSIGGQQVLAYVYRNNQMLEKFELVSLKYTDTNTNKIRLLDVDNDWESILKLMLIKFGIMIPYNTSMIDNPIIGNYIKLSLNPKIFDYLNDYKNNLDVLKNIVKSLCSQTIKNKSHLKNGTNPSDEHVQHEIQYCYYPLSDKYQYDVKYISNGGYVDKIIYSQDYLSTLTTDRRYIEDAMLNLVSTRQDCVAYLDVPYNLHVDEVPYYFDHISSSYAAAYDPWCLVALETGTQKWMPPSFVQLYTHAKSIKNGNKNYLPSAGVRRGLVPEIISTAHDLNSKYITEWQNDEAVQFINPILWINGYDYTIYGQKTLYNVINQSYEKSSALQNLNVRLVANDIKKLIFNTCLNLTFELNNLRTWNEFKSAITPQLKTMLAEGVISEYDVVMGKETMTEADLNSGHCVGTIKVAIVSASIDWDINFQIEPNNVTFFDQDYNSIY